ncbi:hypothetical protein Cgig2_008888 [Carnegiea gigantea]|uniref:Uncharacterized protein n=1 Tax=Carnegiea gigantea TaxID=171969 RepID=A0A9Q1KL86_9CARY|nr:hypothetical protein Cgig2_008888 [Carnegiea gigantea]
MAFLDFLSTGHTVNYIRTTFLWCLREASCPPRPLPEDYHGLCPYLDLDMSEESSLDFHIPKMTQAIFYTMVLNEAERRIAKTKTTARLRSPDRLMAEGTSKGNPPSSSGSSRSSTKVEVESTSTSSSLEGETSSSGRAMLKKRGRAQKKSV